MEPQPSTSTAVTMKAGACDDGGSSDGTVPSTSGGAPIPAPQQQEEELVFTNYRTPMRQIHQLFVATCRVKLQRCQYPALTPIIQTGNSGSVANPSAEEPERPTESSTVTVAKVEEEMTGSGSSSDVEEVKVLLTSLAKKKGGKGSSKRKSSAYCTLCKKRMSSKDSLKVSLRMHTEEKPHFCVVNGCGQSFRHSNSLKKHRRLVHLKRY